MAERMICHTRNFEDVMLQRVFLDVPAGHFIDVGASNAAQDSNTFALYRKGWRGVALEPLADDAQWRQVRPHDVLLKAAAGSQPGMLTLHVYDEARQISSGSSATVAHWQAAGRKPSRSIEVPVLTLNDIIDQHLRGRPLHLVSIDVEGMEGHVLKGLDLAIHRPWVLIVEATVPGTPGPAHQSWEPDLLEAGYLLAYFDGVNRFYLAREQRHLLGRFALPPNVWDNFVNARELVLEQRVAQLEAALAAAKATPASGA